jgi:hypothetical protein
MDSWVSILFCSSVLLSLDCCSPMSPRPYAPGDWNDLEIFRVGLKLQLDEGERVEADDICVGEAPEFVKCPCGFTRPEEEKDMRKRVDGRHETINNKIKHWKCLVNPFKSKEDKVAKHSSLFRACAVATQVGLELGIGELFVVGDDYE